MSCHGGEVVYKWGQAGSSVQAGVVGGKKVGKAGSLCVGGGGLGRQAHVR